MGQGTKVEFATTTEVTRVAEYLMRIADGLREGSVNLIASGRTVCLEPAHVVRLEMEAKNTPHNGRISLGLEISWTTATPGRNEPSAEVTLPRGA